MPTVTAPVFIISRWNCGAFYVIWDYTLAPVNPITEIGANIRKKIREKHSIDLAIVPSVIGNNPEDRNHTMIKYILEVSWSFYDGKEIEEQRVQDDFLKNANLFIHELVDATSKWMIAPDGYAAVIGADATAARDQIDAFCERLEIRDHKKPKKAKKP